ncbi:MAG: phospholipase A [Marinobacter sp.]|uniref:phospholipase A n=1 Tax=Marinobacter sp. TaxID=50741 RepID=UPI00349FDAE7
MILTRSWLLFTAVLITPTGAYSQAQTSEQGDISPRDCALIEDGVKRLACYDANSDPQLAREAASEQEIEATETATEMLQTDENGHTRLAAESDERSPLGEAEQDHESGFMKSLVNRYVAAEKALFSFSGGFVSHRPMYLMPATWAHEPNQTPFSPRTGTTNYDDPLDNEEAKYQISFKVPLLTGIFDNRTTFWFGYTQLSFWQIYNTDNSAPFRETTYQPELFLRYEANLDFGPGTFNTVALGFNHQSNGRSEPESRSWNRILSTVTYSYDRWLFIVSPWYRLPESDDDNPDIESYLGYADYWAVYKLTEDKTISLKLRNNLKSSDNRTSVELGYSFPLGDALKGYIQYYNGYGESLIDYNHRIQRIGIGIMLNDWL